MKAQEFDVAYWIDSNGEQIESVLLADFENKFKVIFCFQSWCPGCHSIGFPNFKKIVDALNGNPNIAFIAIQTVFEGFEENTFDKIGKHQRQYDLKIPFGHDAGVDGLSSSRFMERYQTRGTPWFVLIDQDNNILFSDFHLNVDKIIEFLKQFN